MAREQRKLVEKLESFTNSLGDIVDILKEDVKNRKDDASDKIAMGISDNITKIAEDLAEVKKDMSGIKKDTAAIKTAVESLKKQKEKGMMGEVGDRKSVSQIKQGISVIMLLAAGVLAIGLAFKIVGRVDFISVIALSIGMIAIAKAAEIIGNIKGLTYKKAVMAATTMVLMAGALTLSSMVLKYIQPMSAPQMITTILLAGALGLATFLLFKALNKIKVSPKALLIIPLLPIILPLISLGIMASSLILSEVVPIPLMTLVGIILLAVAVGVMMYAIKPILSMKLKAKDVAKILLLPLIIPIIAGAIVGASYIFQLFKPISPELALNILIGGLAMGIAIAGFAVSIRILGKMDIKSLAIGAAGAIAVALSLVGVSWIMELFNPNAKAPKLEWTIKVGLALIIFSLPVLILGSVIQASGVALGLAALGLGMIGMVLVALAIVAVSHIISLGNYEKSYPGLKWILGVGASLIAFSVGMLVLGNPLFLALLAIGVVSMGIVATAIQMVSKELAKGDYKTSYPSLGWALGVTAALMPFSLFMVGFGIMMLASFGLGKKILEKGVVALLIVVGGMVKASNLLVNGSWKRGGYPLPEWSGGVANSIMLFAKTLAILKILGETPDGFVLFIENISEGMVKASNTLATGNWSAGYPSKKWSEGVGEGIGAFTNPIIELAQTGRKMMKMIAKDPEAFKSFIIGFIEAISLGMVAAAETLAKGNWGGPAPSKEWATAVGIGIGAFTEPIIQLANSGKKMMKMIAKDPKGFTDFIKGFIEAISWGLVKASIILSFGKWGGGFPIKTWVDGVSTAINAFMNPIIKLAEGSKKIQKMIKKGDFTDFVTDVITGLATGLVLASFIFNDGKWDGAVPSKEWVSGVVDALKALKITEKDSKLVNNFVELIKVFNKLPSVSIYGKLNRIAKGFYKLSHSLDSFKDSAKSLEVLKSTANTMLLFSVIDSKQIAKTLDILDKKTNTLKKVSLEAPSIIAHLEELLDAAGNINVYQTVDSEGGGNEAMSNLVNHVSNIDKNIEEMLDLQKDNKDVANDRYKEAKEMANPENVND
jgi:hypothetical protein